MPFNRQLLLLLLVLLIAISALILYNKNSNTGSPLQISNTTLNGGVDEEEEPHPLTIEYLRNLETPGSDIVIEQTLSPGSNYERYIVSYKSEGLKIYALMTVPKTEKPEKGFPVVVFNHGYIQPSQYRTAERYIAYTDTFSRNGYIVLKSDYRGHGSSEGTPRGGYGYPDYVIDILNAVESIRKYPSADPDKIGMWGHSMGGFITIRSMVARDTIKAGVIWAGVSGSYEELLYNWRRRATSTSGSPTPTLSTRGGSWRNELVQKYKTPEENPEFWNSISANFYVNDISGPLQLHHGTADTSVPLRFSQKLEEDLKKVNKEVELHTYTGDDHNLSANLFTALDRSVKFFDKYLKENKVE